MKIITENHEMNWEEQKVIDAEPYMRSRIFMLERSRKIFIQ